MAGLVFAIVTVVFFIIARTRWRYSPFTANQLKPVTWNGTSSRSKYDERNK
jgi:hypothetical protein